MNRQKGAHKPDGAIVGRFAQRLERQSLSFPVFAAFPVRQGAAGLEFKRKRIDRSRGIGHNAAPAFRLQKKKVLQCP